VHIRLNLEIEFHDYSTVPDVLHIWERFLFQYTSMNICGAIITFTKYGTSTHMRIGHLKLKKKFI
jgi:hypothetical protein